MGATDAGKMAMQRMMSQPDLGYHLSGFVDHRGSPQVRNSGRFRAPGNIDDLPELIESGEAGEIIVALPSSAHEEMWSILTLCEKHDVDLKIIPDLFELNLSRVQVDDIAGIPLLNVGEPPLRRIAWVGKRAVDLAVGTLVLAIASPVLAVLAILIRIETPGAALLRQQRIGLGGRSSRATSCAPCMMAPKSCMRD